MFRSHSETFRTDLKTKPSHSLQAFGCDLCDKSCWLSETDVEIHRKEVHFALIRTQMQEHQECFCTVCMTLQESHSALITHVKTRHLLSSPTARRIEREIFICDHCDHIFFNKDLLQAHIMYLHLWPTRERNLKTFSCPKCKKICKLKSIWFHLQLHEIPSLSVCDICLTHFPSIRELQCHLKTHQMFYKCDICNYQTTKDFHFEAHLDKHRQSPLVPSAKIGKLTREAFGRHTSTLSSSMIKYNIHHSLKGLELPKFINICSLCREICTDKIEVKRHILRDHLMVAEVKKPSRCLCGEEFFNRVLLKHHIFKAKSEQHKHRELNENEQPELKEPQKGMIKIEIIDSKPSTQYVVTSNAADMLVGRPARARKKKMLSVAETLGETEVSVDRVIKRQKVVETEMVPEETSECEDGQKEEAADELTYIYAEIDEDQLVTIDSETNEEVISF